MFSLKSLSLKPSFIMPFLTGMFIALVVGCGQTDDQRVNVTINNGTADNFSSPFPVQLEKLRPGLTAKVVVDGGTANARTIDLRINTQTTQVEGTIPELSAGQHTFEIQYFIDGVLVTTATVTASIQAGAATPVTFDASSFVFPDTDGDTFANLVEVEIFGAASNQWQDNAVTPAGQLDVSFDVDGVVNTEMGSSAFAQAVEIQSDGKIVVAGGSGNTFTLARYNTDGSLDTSFGTGGIVTTAIGTSAFAADVKIHTDGKIVIAGTSFDGTSKFAVARYNSDGSLDTSFDTDGIVTTAIGIAANAQAVAIGIAANAQAVAIQADGKIIAGGNVFDGTTNLFAVARYNTNGSLDTTFNTVGIVTTSISTFAAINDIALQTDGKIVAVGGSSNGFAVARYNTTGSLDTSFSIDGFLTTLIGTFSSAQAVVIEAGTLGKIVVVGNSSNGFAAARYNSTNGSLDTTFNTTGTVATAVGSSSAQGAVIQPDGKIVAVGTSFDSSVNKFALVRYNTNGLLDISFDTDGILTTTLGNSASLSDAAIQNEAGVNRIIAVGGTGGRFALARYNLNNGSLNTTFGGAGTGTTTTIIGSSAFAQTVIVQPDGKTVAAGSIFDDIPKAALTRYNADGSLDTTFDTDGIVNTTLGSSASVSATALQLDGKIVAAGNAFDGVNNNFVVIRYNSDGSPDTTFDTDGIVTTVIGTSSNVAAVAVQTDGKIVVAGNSFSGSNRFTVVRYNADGSPDTTFDTDGIATAVPPGTSNFVTDVALQTDGKIVVAGNTFEGKWKPALARFNPDGTLDITFDADGIATTVLPGTSAFAQAVALSTEAKIIFAGNLFEGTNKFIVVRYNADGSLDTTFETDGIAITTLPGTSNFAQAVVLQNDGKVIVAGSVFEGSINKFALVRYNTDGSLDTTFDIDGIVITTIGRSSASATGLAVQTDNLGTRIAVSGSSDGRFTVARYWATGRLP